MKLVVASVDIVLEDNLSGFHSVAMLLTRKSRVFRIGLLMLGLSIVFVFTLDCNKCIYCYDTGDGFSLQPTG